LTWRGKRWRTEVDMKRIFDFRCSTCRRKFEAIVDLSSTMTIRCSCGQTAYKVLSPVRASLDPLSGHFPSATDKWAKEHEQKAKSTSS